jgi:hypothetical protein
MLGNLRTGAGTGKRREILLLLRRIPQLKPGTHLQISNPSRQCEWGGALE